METIQPDWVFVSSEDPGQVLLQTAIDTMPERTIYIAHTPLQLPFGPHSFQPDARQAEAIRRAAGIITVSNYVKNYIEHWGKTKATVVPFPVFGDGFCANLGCADKGFVTLVNPCAYKGLSIFLDLARRFPSVPFAAVPTWGTTRADLAALKAAQVTVLEPADDIGRILEQTRVLLLPSLWMEAFGLLSIEAMGRGIPVLASNVGGLPEAKLGVDYVLPVCPIERYEEQFDDRDYPVPVVPPQPCEIWAGALGELLSDRARYEFLSLQSQKAAQAFVSGVSVRRFEEFLKVTANATTDSPAKRLAVKRQALRELRALRVSADTT